MKILLRDFADDKIIYYIDFIYQFCFSGFISSSYSLPYDGDVNKAFSEFYVCAFHIMCYLLRSIDLL